MKRRRLFASIISMLLAAAMLVGCGKNDTDDVPQNNDDTGTTASTNTNTGEAQHSGPEHSIQVSTAYGDLYYQDQWEGVMIATQTQDDDTIAVVFGSEINGTVYLLFEVMIGNGSGSLVGQLTDNSGTQRNVYARMFELTDITALTEDEQNRLYAMQEDINFVISNLN